MSQGMSSLEGNASKNIKCIASSVGSVREPDVKNKYKRTPYQV